MRLIDAGMLCSYQFFELCSFLELESTSGLWCVSQPFSLLFRTKSTKHLSMSFVADENSPEGIPTAKMTTKQKQKSDDGKCILIASKGIAIT
jgi:hypothetical protein